MLNIIAFLAILLSLGLIIYILYRKMPLLKQVNFDEVNKEKQKKYRIIEERLRRKLQIFGGKLSSSSVAEKFRVGREKMQGFYTKIKVMKGMYRARQKKQDETKLPSDANTPQEVSDEALNQARNLVKENKLAEAEEMVIRIIKENPRHLDAYKTLAQIYLGNKNWEHAAATLEHITRLGERLKFLRAADLLDLADVKLKLEKAEEALAHMKKAISLEPLNPKVLHFMVKLCIRMQQKELAWKYYQKLKKTNKDAEFLEELLMELKKMG